MQCFQQEVSQGKCLPQLQALHPECMLLNVVEYVLHVADGTIVISTLLQFRPKAFKAVLRVLPIGSSVNKPKELVSDNKPEKFLVKTYLRTLSSTEVRRLSIVCLPSGCSTTLIPMVGK